MVDLATRALLGQTIVEQGWPYGLHPSSGLVAVKAPVFSMSKLPQVDTYLGPEMKSTGEVMGVDWDGDAAMAKALLAAGTSIPPQAPVLLSIADRDKDDAVAMIRALAEAGHPLLATEGTARMIEGLGLTVRGITKRLSEGHPNVLDAIEQGWVGAVVNTISGRRGPLKDGFQIRRAAVERRIPCFTSLDTARAAVWATTRKSEPLQARPLGEYLAGRPEAVEQGVG
jgi:carbamoyl-phosphate synthase large subunit